MKVWDKAALTMGVLMLDILDVADEDGMRTPAEQRMIERAKEAYAYVEETAARQRLAQRIAGGGAIDRQLRGEVTDALMLDRRHKNGQA